jgi:GT2 family glycosyltransferase
MPTVKRKNNCALADENESMTSQPRPESCETPPPKSMPERFPPRRRTLGGLWWAFTTLLRKQKIAWEDKTGAFGYHQWIETVERKEVAALLRKARGPQAGEITAVFLIGGEYIPEPLTRTVRSLQQQGADWLAALFLPAASPLREEVWLQELLKAEPRLCVVTADLPDRPFAWAAIADEIMRRFSGDWLIPLGVGDVLAEGWANLLALYAQQSPGADVIYWDEDILSALGERVNPFLKPDWSPELLYAINYLGGAAFRAEFLKGVCAPGLETPAGWIFDAVESAHQIAHIPFVLQHCHEISGEDQGRALAAHAGEETAALERRGFREVNASILPEGALRLRWKVEAPLVSIIIPTKNSPTYLKRCLNTLFERTSGVKYEIILMDDHSTDPEVLAYYQTLLQEHDNIRLVENQGDFNYSAVNNAGARIARGDLLLFLNNDVEIVNPDWLVEMVRWAQMPGVGMVGAKLLYPDGSIQHAGIVPGMTGHAGHLFAGKQPVRSTLFLSPEVTRNVSAVTGACMLVRRDLFMELNGFAEDLVLVFNDVDLGVRMLRAGYRVVYNPAAALIHYEGRSRARYMPPRDIRLGAERLSAEIERGDHYYHPNLSLEVNWPTFRRPREISPLARLKKIVRYKG